MISTASPRSRALLRLVAALSLLALFAAPALRPDTYLSRRDIARLHLPLREFTARELAAGRFPTWNHLDGLGTSIEGTAIAAPLHPAQLLLLVAPPDVALKLQVLLALVLAALGAGLLARRQGGPEPAWWFAGVAYAGSGYLLSVTDNFTFLHGAALLPWVLLAAERLAEQPTPPRGLALGALLALGLHGGDVQGTLLACLLGAGWALGLARARGATLGALALAALFTVALAAPLLPAVAATAVDTGRAAGLGLEEALRWSLTPVRLLELIIGPLVPVASLDFHGELFGKVLGGHTGALWAVSEAVGVAVLVLAPLGLLADPGGQRGRRFAALALGGLLLALGASGGLYPLLLRTVPGWNAFRYPEKLMPFAVLGLAVLSARGLSLAPRRAHLVLPLGAFLALVPLGTLSTEAFVAAFEALGGARDALPAALADQLASALRASAAVALSSCAALALAAWRWPQQLPRVALAALVLQGAWCARDVVATRPRAELQRPPQLLEAVRAAGGDRTRLAAWPERYSFRGQRFAATEAVALGDSEALAPNHNVRFGVGNISAYSPGAMGELERTCSLRPLCTSFCARRLGAGLCIVSEDFVKRLAERGAEVLARSDRPLLALLRDEKARAWASVPGVRPQGPGESLKDALMRSGDDLRAVLREVAAELPPEPAAVTRWERPRPALAEVDLTLAQDNVLVVAEHCARGWRASVDGQAEVTPLRADGGLCAVPVPAGMHRVTLRYVPPGWPWAWALFALGLSGCVFVLVRARPLSAASRPGTASAS